MRHFTGPSSPGVVSIDQSSCHETNASTIGSNDDGNSSNSEDSIDILAHQNACNIASRVDDLNNTNPSLLVDQGVEVIYDPIRDNKAVAELLGMYDNYGFIANFYGFQIKRSICEDFVQLHVGEGEDDEEVLIFLNSIFVGLLPLKGRYYFQTYKWRKKNSFGFLCRSESLLQCIVDTYAKFKNQRKSMPKFMKLRNNVTRDDNGNWCIHEGEDGQEHESWLASIRRKLLGT